MMGGNFASQTWERVCARDLAAQSAPELCKFVVPLLKRGRRECRVRAAPAVSCAKDCAFGAHEHTGERRTLQHPLRNGFTAYFVLSPVERACCHRRPQENFRSFSPAYAAPGPHDLTVRSRPGFAKRLRRAIAIRQWRAASIASRAQRVVTMAIRPSCGHETGKFIILIFRICKRIFLYAGLTAQISLRLLRKLDFTCAGASSGSLVEAGIRAPNTGKFLPSTLPSLIQAPDARCCRRQRRLCG
jgi:hypothetical protein